MGRDFADLEAERTAIRAENGLPNEKQSPFQGPDGNAETASNLPFFSVAEFAGKAAPERKWHVPSWVPTGSPTLFSGDGGTGKSLIANQLAVATVAGRPWFGLPVQQGGAMVISAEDDKDELHRRFDDIATADEVSLADLGRLTLLSLAGEDALLAIDSPFGLFASPLLREIEGRIAIERPALVVFDTLADFYPANENDRARARQFVGLLRGTAIRNKCAVLLLAHPSVAGMANGSGYSGSTAWNASVRSRFYLSRVISDGYEADPDARVLSVKKSNYGRTGHEIPVRWQDGVFVAEKRETGLDRMASDSKAERAFLRLLNERTAQGRYVSSNPGPTYAPTEFASDPDAEGCTKVAFKRAMDALFHRGEIVVAEHGRGSKARSHIARKGGGNGPD